MNRRLRGLSAAAVVGVFVVCASSLAFGAAIAPKPSALLGGGWVGPVYSAAGHPYLTLVNIRVAPDGKTATVYLDLVDRCVGTYSTYKVPVTVKNVAVASGSFTAKGDMHDQNPAAHGSYFISGHFVSPTSAVGFAYESYGYLGGAVTENCVQNPVNWQARADSNLSSAPGKPAVKAGATYYGNTSQRFDFVLRVMPNGRRVAQAAALMNVHCSKDAADYFVYADPVAPASSTIGRSGSFVSTEKYTTPVTTQAGVATTAQVTQRLVGRFGATSVAGTWEVQYVLHDASTGALVDTCTSKVVRFKGDL